MTNNVAGGSFPFRRAEKPFSIFRVPKTRSFVKQPPNKSFSRKPVRFELQVHDLMLMIFFKSFLVSQDDLDVIFGFLSFF